MSRRWSLQEVAQHDTSSSCWVIIRTKVYDVTTFLSVHPGGADIILRHAGLDVTVEYESIHQPHTLERSLPAESYMGDLNSVAAHRLAQEHALRRGMSDEFCMENNCRKPPIDRVLNLRVMEEAAKSVMSSRAWDYYSSGSDDEITLCENMRAFSRFFFMPRAMMPVSNCDISTTILGFKSSIPVFISGAAGARLGHPLGEANITRGAGRTGIIQMVSSNASLSYAEIAASRISDAQALFFQLYKHTDALAETRIHEVESLGYNAIFLTVDAIVSGFRVREIRDSFVPQGTERASEQTQTPVWHANVSSNVPRAPTTSSRTDEEVVKPTITIATVVKPVDRDMSWERTIPWLRMVSRLPIVIKGIQTVEDAVLAADAGVDGIVVSNHGGRQLEFSLPPIEVLYKIRKQRPDVFGKLEVYLDGGVRRGTDVVKALCLGARAVGLGRPFLFAQSAYGEEGVVQVVRILEREILTTMRLLGASTLKDLEPSLVERVDWQPRYKL
ncbi:hypothetical protein OBBRIDRAFT_754729 [Obba rivulosa]|uniref:(S)-2-hydroxy-acid oxidase n=1 Tax=Obba rivulosa TaxID=1052685 RepID=A0A8E2AU10_9APHY|nr:hypothetical protein OBBRIDRAFT_754729 [Obba rivulosa]